MEDHIGVIDALEALLAKASGRLYRVLVADGAARTCSFSSSNHRTAPDRDLPKLLRDRRERLDVLVVVELSTTLLRAVRERPPGLLVVVGDMSDDMELPTDMLVLGPHATLHVGDGDTIACASEGPELQRLCDALGSHRLALAPTPVWLPRWLEHPQLGGYHVAGYVPHHALSYALASWSTSTKHNHVLVPLGVEEARVDRSRDPSLLPAAVAHTLERFTGPLFPAPHVIALTLRGSSHSEPTRALAPNEHAIALWNQAKRALPMTGAVVGMQQPRPELSLEIPTAAFLAQRALLGIERARQTIANPSVRPQAANDDAVHKAREILSRSGTVLSEHESKVVLRSFGFEITRQAVATSASGAAQFADKIGYPVVLKAVSPDLRRKQELGAVVLDLHNAASVRRAFGTIQANVEQRAPTARMDGILVAEMVGEGLEIQVGGIRTHDDRIVLYGRPQSLSLPIEPVLALHPLRPHDAVLLAEAVLTRLAAPAWRRASDPDVHVLAEVFFRLDELFTTTRERLLSVDLNPIRLVGLPRRYVTLDARIVQRPHLEGQ